STKRSQVGSSTMKSQQNTITKILNTTLAIALVSTALTSAGAQRNRRVNPITGGTGQTNNIVTQRGSGATSDPGVFNNTFAFGSFGFFGYGGAPLIYMGDNSIYNDPPIAITPFGIQPLGYGNYGSAAYPGNQGA